jgi:hypothetical protein
VSHRQLSGGAPGPDGQSRLALSASKELEPGVRAMLLDAPGLFRLDVTLLADTLRATVRNLSSGELTMHDGDGYGDPLLASGEVARNEPTVSTVRFTLSDTQARVRVTATIGVLRFPTRGTARITAQAVAAADPDDGPPPT